MKTKSGLKALMLACTILCSCVPISGYAQENKGIHFEDDSLSVLLAQAKREKKLIFIDAYASWCVPCKLMDESVFTNDTVGKFYNSNFINVQINMEKGAREDLAEKYDVFCFPTFLFIDSTGMLVHRQSGMCTAQNFIELGKNALNPENQFCTLQKKYESRTATMGEFIRYMRMRKATCLATDEYMAHYDSVQVEANLTGRENWEVLHSGLITDPHCRIFQHLATCRTAYDEIYTADSVNQVIIQVYRVAMSKCILKKEPDIDGYKKLQAEIAALNDSAFDPLVLESNIMLYAVTEDWDKYAESATLYVEKCKIKDNWILLNYFAWIFYENVSDTAYLDTAIAWAERSIAITESYYNTDTYAALLYKRGRLTEAEIQAKRAIELAEEEGVDYPETEKLLGEIKAAQNEK